MVKNVVTKARENSGSLERKNLALLGLFMDDVAQLRLPLEAGDVFHTLVDEPAQHITCMNIDGTQRDECCTVEILQGFVDLHHKIS